MRANGNGPVRKRKIDVAGPGIAKDGRALPLPKSGLLQKHGPGEGVRNGYVVDDDHRKIVTIMRSNAMGIEAIAAVMGVNKDTLRSLFAVELANGFESIRGQMGAALVNAGINGNVSAMKFWLANRCPEWRVAKDEAEDPADNPLSNDVVHFFLPSNHRDEPEDLGPTIDGTTG